MRQSFFQITRDLVIILLLLIAGLFLFEPNTVAWAKQFIPLEGEGFGVFPRPEGETGIEIAKSLVGRIVDNVRYIIGAVAILMIIISSFQLIRTEGNEEEFNKQRKALIFGIAGLIIVALAGDLSQILTVEKGGFIRDPTKTLKQVRIFNRTVEIILVFMKYIIGAIATIFLVRNGLRMVVLGGNEEELAKDKKNIAWSLIGLIIILVASPLVNNVFYKIDTSKYPGQDAVRPIIDATAGLRELVGITNFVVTFVGPFAILSLIAGGILYITAAGEEEKTGKAKKIIMWALIGLLVIYGAFGIVSTFVARKFEGI